MSCSSCVAKITGLLEEREWITRANVNLLTRTASVDMFSDHDAQELVTIFKGAGYEATVEQVERVEQQTPPGRNGPDGSLVQWQATLSIGGMTCSSCVGTITETLRTKPWTKTVDVNLVTHSATIVFENKANLDNIIEAIQDLGYEASINDVVDLAKARRHDARRTLSVKVEGLYCQHCPGRILDAVKSFGDRVTIEKAPTSDDPIITVSYLPEAPNFTVRSILTTIASADKAFEPTIFHPPTLEERSRQLLARSRRRLLYRTLLTIVIAIPSLVIGIVYMNLVSDHDPGRMYLMEKLAGVSRAEWANFIMATPVYFFAADIFHRRTVKELYNLWKPGSTVPLARRFYRFGSMDMLICFATTIAYVASIVELIIAATLPEGKHMSGSVSYFDSVVFLTMFLLIGRMIEAFSKAKTGEAVSKLGNLRPKEALLVVSGDQETGPAETVPTPVAMLDTGDIIRIVHGGSPPWDGFVTEGETDFAESSLTGESRPIKKRPGDPIYAGTINKGGPITVKITGAAGDSLLDQIIKVVREGQARRAPMERVADTITGYFVPIVTLIAILTWLIWLGLGVSGRLPDSYLDISIGGWPFWSLQFAIAVFVIACPCGIGLAAPTALFVGGGLAAKHGILAKGGGEAFQEASKLDVVVFDKTGTLTEGGEPKLTDQQFLDMEDGIWTRQILLGCLGELESNSSHPIAKAIVAFCKSSNKTSVKAKNIEEVPGKGMKGSFRVPSSGDVEIIVGNEALMKDHGVRLDNDVLDTLNTWKHEAKSVVLTAVRTKALDATDSWGLAAIFGTSDPLRPESKRVIEALRKQRIDVWMLSGDNQATANAVGALAGIPPDRIIAGVLPEQKADKIQYLQKSQVKVERRFLGIGKSTTRHATVAMVGDGVNDSPALTVADVGIAIGSGSDVAISAAEFVLVNSSLTTLVTLTQLSRAVFRRVRFNFAWAMIYNMVALPVAAGVFYAIQTESGSHVRLDPVWAALAMACSSLSVICSSLLLQCRLPLVGYRGSDMEV
jgi:heavy metal translocating P-type ATPase